MKNSIKLTMAIAGALLLINVCSAQAAIVIDAVETGGDVVFTYSGTVNQGGWELIGGGFFEFARIDPDALVYVGPTPSVPSAQFRNPNDLQGPDNFGTGTDLAFATSGTGDIFGLNFDEGLLNVPGGYVRFDPISGTSTYRGETFASLGMAPGSYTWTWDTLPYAEGTDSVTLNVVPIPGAVWLLGSGLLGVIGFRRRSKT